MHALWPAHEVVYGRADQAQEDNNHEPHGLVAFRRLVQRAINDHPQPEDRSQEREHANETRKEQKETPSQMHWNTYLSRDNTSRLDALMAASVLSRAASLCVSFPLKTAERLSDQHGVLPRCQEIGIFQAGINDDGCLKRARRTDEPQHHTAHLIDHGAHGIGGL